MTHQMTCKQFGSTLLGGTVLLLIQPCGGGGSDSHSAYGGNNSGTGCGNTISDNHGHVLTIAVADLDSTSDMTYNIQGSADHTHSITLTAANLANLKSHTGVAVTTTTNA